MFKKDILIGVIGLTPQVITETIYCFYTKEPKFKIKEVYVITTLPGKEKIEEELLQKGRFDELCKILRTKIKFDENHIHLITDKNGNPLKDIRTIEDNKRVAEKIWEVLEEYTRNPDVRIHASVAGGRKTMGFFLAIFMCILGREGDTLSHVLVDEEKESSKFYFPKTKSEEEKLNLAIIPYIRLREFLRVEKPEKKIDFLGRIKSYQIELERVFFPHIQLDFEDKKVIVNNRDEIKMSEREFFLYSLFAKKAKEKVDFIDIQKILEYIPEHLEEYGRFFNFPDEFKDKIGKERIYELISRINSKIEKCSAPQKDILKVQKMGERKQRKYGLKIPDTRIEFKR